ncbi:MAG: hypothetical protein A2Y54_04425 [Chloroflexi bacterium RBG_16_51_16]|nr:MAG: hypothetical protein A2Y54_04425 [Chloroflexi bacterium RBG_16_51_16]
MGFHQKNGICFLSFDLFPKYVIHGIFTRRGGVSPEPWESLNVGSLVGDDPENVRENRNRIFLSMDRPPFSIHDVWLVHGTSVVHAEAPRGQNQLPVKADILFTDSPDVTLFMRFADCVPLLFCDPIRNAIGIGHAGWLGTARGVATAAVQAMMDRYGSKPKDLIVGLGPSIGPDHYEVRSDVVKEFGKVNQQESEVVLKSSTGRTYLDLWKANQIQLMNLGVQNIEVSKICTACHPDDWYSHRLENGRTGRFGALIGIAR